MALSMARPAADSELLPTATRIPVRSSYPPRGGPLPLHQACMRILAIDHGSRRMGLAISDELGVIAQPLGYLPAEPFDGLIESLRKLAHEREVEMILVGIPRNMDGSYGPAAIKVQEFVAVIKNLLALRVQTWDERLTSVQANRFLAQAEVRGRQRREKVDQTAAAILLQSYLDSLNPGP
jgi:putative holliday junction resolvase